MATNRSIPVCIILTLVTCGIYGIYWYYMIAGEVPKVTGDTDSTSAGMVVLLTIITCGIYGIYWGWKTGEKLDNARTANGQSTGTFAVLFLVLNLFGLEIVTWAIIQNELNQYAPL